MEETQCVYDYEQQERVESQDVQQELFRQMGGVYGWCRQTIRLPHSRTIHRGPFMVWLTYESVESWDYRLLYWRSARYPSLRHRVPTVRQHRVWSGYRSFGRGRHWDRKRR